MKLVGCVIDNSLRILDNTYYLFMKKYVFTFGNSEAEGDASMRNLLGGKGANLAEMNLIGVPVPPGFTITTEICTIYNQQGKNAATALIKENIKKSINKIEKITNTKFGDKENPCLVSVRSGARISMPGMMDTVLNLGMNDQAVMGIAKKTGNERFAWDSYRRFVQMYGDVVLGMKPENKEDIDPFEEIIENLKKEKNIQLDTQFTTEDLKILVTKDKQAIKRITKITFPENPWEQLLGAIYAVFDSWMTDRAIYYRKINKISDEWGTAVNVQAMVYGNMGKNSATGVAFSRNAATGEDKFNGEYLIDAQGEDVVAGTRTPQQITIEGSKLWAKLTGITEEERKNKYPSLEETMPVIYKQLFEIQQKLEDHYKDMQDLEFTIQEGKLWLLQTRNGKRTGSAMVKIAIDMLSQGIIDEETALLRIEPAKLDELLHPVFDQNALQKVTPLSHGLPASPGAATGQVVFFADESAKYKKSILIRLETSPEDLEGMHRAQGILTGRGGMTSHAAVVARGMGKCCISGAGSIIVNYKKRTATIGEKILHEGDWISLDGSTGKFYEGKIQTTIPDMNGDFGKILDFADKHSRLKVETNADTPKDAKIARSFGAQGIGLCRTEHMFFNGERIKAMRKMILSSDIEDRKKYLDKLLPYQRSDFEGIFEAMQGLSVTIRLLDPPLHEFVPKEKAMQKELAEEMGISLKEVKNKIANLKEFNPMLGHRGCRLGITFPEITAMQTKAIIEAALNLKAKGIVVHPEIMVPLVGTVAELKNQKTIINETANTVFKERNDKIKYLVGTMIEIPRAALTADHIAMEADFFSFGTNDLTQMTLGYSRDDVGKFLPDYLDNEILKNDPFQILDRNGVGQLIKIGVEKGRAAKPGLKIGICGEHGGDPSSVEFFDSLNLDYISCSPYRVPIARIAAAQANIRNNK